MKEMTLKLIKPWLVIALIVLFGTVAFSQTKDIKTVAKEFLDVHEIELKQTNDPYKQFYILYHLARAAYFAGETDKAKDYSARLVETADKTKSQAGFGPSRVADATHISNTILGLIAFDKNDIEIAKDHLLAAGKIVGGSPTLKSFGPSMYLANRLLEKGEGETVIKYLDLCAGFWELDRGNLEKWKGSIKKGESPKFGPSLTTAILSWRFVDTAYPEPVK
jgi:hypothetical protein